LPSIKYVAQRGLHACRQTFGADRTAILEKSIWPACVFVGRFSGRTAILEFFSSRKVAELAKRLAQDVATHYPPAIANNPAQMVSQQRLSSILEQVFARATAFSREHKLGWYKRARLGNDFRWELNELGYDKKFIDTATEGLILCVSRNLSLKT
jgi:hypothetical protein